MTRQRLTITLKKRILKKIDQLIDGTRIKNRSHAIEFLLSQKFGEQKITRAVILAGGQGIKLKGKRKLVSKILMPIKRKPLIEHNFDLLRKYGITKVIFAPGKLGKEIKKYINNGSRFNLEISYLGQDLGTADSLRLLKNLVNETFLMMNGDILLEVDLEDMLDFHKKCGGLCTIAMVSVKDPSKLGTIKLKGNQIIGFIEKPTKGREESYLVNAGIYIMEPEICQFVSAKFLSLEKDLFPFLAKKGKLFGYPTEGRWFHKAHL